MEIQIIGFIPQGTKNKGCQKWKKLFLLMVLNIKKFTELKILLNIAKYI